MSLHKNCHTTRTTLSGRIQIGHKSGYLLFIYCLSVNIKPPRHRFGFSLAWGWQFVPFGGWGKMFTGGIADMGSQEPYRELFPLEFDML